MQVSHRWTHSDRFQMRIGEPLRPLDRVPEDLKISTQPQAVWRARAEDVCQIEEANLLAPCRKAQIWFGHNPAALAIGDFHAQRLRPNFLTLTDRHVDRRISRVHPTFGNQPQWATLGCVLAKIDLDVMIARHTLITPAPKIIEILLVQSTDNFRHVVAAVIFGMLYLVWRLDGRNCQLRRRNNKTFIDEDVCSRWMVHGHQRQLIVVVGFPQFSRNAQIIITIAWHEFVAADLVPLFGGFDFRRPDRVDAQTDRRTPGHGVFYKLHFLAVVSEEKGA